MNQKSPKYPILITIPHASYAVPEEIRKNMKITDYEIQQHADLFTDQIYDVSTAYQVSATVSRLVVDVNRSPDDLPIDNTLSDKGVVVGISENGNHVYSTLPTQQNIAERIAKYHDPFHQKITALAPDMKFVIDGHSMRSIGPAMREDAGDSRADIVLGNRAYATCSREMMLFLFRFFREKGFSVKVNDPYDGRYIIGYHCSRKNLQGVLIEVNKSLYMDEELLTPYPEKIQQLKSVMKELVEEIYRKSQ